MMTRRFVQQLRTLCESGKTIDQALFDLRASGASIIECIVALREYKDCSIIEAKRFIHHSDAWRDVAEPTDKMWDEFAMEIQSKKAEQSGGGERE
jgi:hypothetical protein